jgi:hypothetical protein
LKDQYKCEKTEYSKDNHRTEELTVKGAKKRAYFKSHVYQEGTEKIDEAEIIRLQGLLEKEERGFLSSNRAMMYYIETCHNIYVLTEANKSLNMETKKLRRKLQDDQMAKFPQDKNMLEMQL